MSEEFKSKTEKMLELDDSINSYYGIEETKVFDVTSEQKVKLTSVLQNKLARATKNFHSHLRGRIIDLIEPQDWAKFGVTPNPGQKPDPKFDPAFYHKDIKSYEKRYAEKVSGYAMLDLGPEFGSMNSDKIATKKAYEDVLKSDLQEIAKYNGYAKKYGIKLTPYKG